MIEILHDCQVTTGSIDEGKKSAKSVFNGQSTASLSKVVCVLADYERSAKRGARSAERVYFYIPEKSQYERPAGRPAGRGHAL